VPVIFVSSLDRPNLKVKGLELGADDYVVKPFNRAELLARLRVSLRRSARFRRLAGCLGGDLSDVPLPTLLQTLSLAGKTATSACPTATDGAPLELQPATEGARTTRRVALQRGQFVETRYGSHHGKEALARLCLLEADAETARPRSTTRLPAHLALSTRSSSTPWSRSTRSPTSLPGSGAWT
jgi:DNA-binding response OmpR family regulator